MVTYFEVNYKDLDRGITKFLKSKNHPLGRDGYQCVPMNEWTNCSSHRFSVIDDWMPDEEDLKDIAGFGIGEILDWMCAEKLIDPGQYLVNVFW